MAAPTTTNEVTVRRLSEVLVGSDGNGGIKKAVEDKITAAVNALDVAEVGGDGKYIKKIKEVDGKITATVEDMDTTPTASSVKAVTSGGVKTALDGKASSTHTHGRLTNDGKLTNSPFAIENGDCLVITDNSGSSQIAKSAITFDASTTSQVLTKKGTFENASDIIAGDFRSIPQDVSKGANLVVNGSGRMASNYNFSGTTYLPTICNNGSAGSFGFNGQVACNEYISVDFNQRIFFTCDIKNLVTQPSGCWHRIYVNEYDIDKLSIVGQMVLYGGGTLTTLAEDLNPGDTTVHITDASHANWQSTTTHHKGLIFWNYTNSYGYLYPPETYSRNVYPYSDSQSLWANGGVNASTGIITLSAAWTGPAIPAGTKVSRRSSGANFPYPASLAVTDTEWHTLAGYMKGVCAAGENARGTGKFSCGTAFIKVGMYPSSLNNTDTTTNKRAVFTNFLVYELPSLSENALNDYDGNAINTTYLKKATTISGTTIAETNVLTINGSTDGFKLTYASPSSDHAVTKMYTIDDDTSTLSLGNMVGSTYKEAILISNGSATVTGSLSGNATTATTATNANITKTTDTTNGDKLQIGSGTAVNVTNSKHAASADSATSATNVALVGSVKTTSTTNGDTIQFQAGSGTAGTVTIVNAKHAASADSATSATTASNYASSGTIKTALDGKAASDHVHGNITNAGTITADTAIANGTKIATVGTDNKVSRSPISFDGSTTTKALTPKGTFEAFAKSGDITSAIQALDVSSVGGAGKYISAISEQDGKISATATSMDTAPTDSSTNAVTSGGIKTALDAKNDRIVWDAVTKGQTWSRIYRATPTINTVGCSGMLSISATRGSVVCNITFLITSSHAGSNYVNIIELASCNYSAVRVRAVSSSSGDYYLELYDTSQSIAAGTTQTWHCRYIPVLEATVTTYTAFTDGTTIPSGYSAVNDFTTTIGSSAAAIKNITRSGTTFTATRQDGSTFTFTQQDSNTDTLVKATAKTDDVNYKILATASASPTSGNATEAVYDTDITLNPSTNTIAANVSGNAATATSAGKLTTARKAYVTLGTASTSTTVDWSGDTTIPVNGTLAIANGGTGATTAANARTNLSVYSKSEVDSMLGGRIEIVAILPSTGSPGVIYYVGPTGSGGDQYDEYIWSGSAFIKVGEHSIDLSNYVNTLTKSGSGSVVTNISKSGNTITWTQGNISLDNLSTWASTSDVTVSSKSYHTYWPIAPTSSNQVYGVSITDGKLYQIYNNKGTYTVRSYDQDNNTTYTNEKLGQGYATCTTEEATAAKVASLTDYVLVKGGIVAVKFTNGLCASATLNVNSKGAKTIYIHGAAATATTAKEVKALDVAYFMYDGSYYQFLGTDRVFKEAITGLSISGKTITYTKADGSTSTINTQDTTYEFDGTYNASTNKAATVSTVTSKINALDVSDISGFGAGKTLATLTETDGKIAATFQNISITKSQVSDFPTSMTPTSHASSATTYGVGTTANYGHVKLATGDMNGAAHADGVAVSKNHTHSQYQTVLTEMTETEVDDLLAVLT